jgi:predicted nucleic acid-binding protein
VKVFIDTGAFIARFIKNDQYHRQAAELWELLRQKDVKCFTSNFVLDETFTLLGRRAGYRFAHERALNLYASQALTIMRPDLNDEMIGLNYFKKYADQSVSFTDCISFALMDRIKTKRVFTFDKHFPWAGYQLLQ